MPTALDGSSGESGAEGKENALVDFIFLQNCGGFRPTRKSSWSILLEIKRTGKVANMIERAIGLKP